MFLEASLAVGSWQLADGKGTFLVYFLKIFWGLVPGFVSLVPGFVSWVLGIVRCVLGIVFWVLGIVF